METTTSFGFGLSISGSYTAVNPEGHDPCGTGVKGWVWGEIREQCWLSAPIMAMYMLQHMVGLSWSFCVGHLGALPLAAFLLASFISNISGFYVLESPNLQPQKKGLINVAQFFQIE